MSKRPNPIGEVVLIAQIRDFSQLRSPFVRLGIGDDCAVLRPPAGCDLLVTTDFTLEGRHFRRDWHSPESAGHRTLARGLSDLAAMGAQPIAAFLSIALPKGQLTKVAGRRWLDRYFAGLQALAERYRCPLAGGDTSESPTGLILADITLVGAAPRGRELRRSGARPGDQIYVSGALGGAAAELELLQTGKRSKAGNPQLFPEPRIAVGRALLRRGLGTACMDLSDGLSTDLAHLCRESKVRAVVDAANLPIHPLAARCSPEKALHLALNGGEDYELLFTAPASTRVPKTIAGIHITRIGQCERTSEIHPTVTLRDVFGELKPLAAGGWQHLSA